MEFRWEKDLLGEKQVPANAYYGIHTVRATENFPVSGQRVHPELIRALAEVKLAAAQTNMELGLLSPRIGEAIITAAREMINGRWHDQIIVDALQGGAGTSTNMNVNEVLANRALEILGGRKGDYTLVHPLRHVNLHQSTNDVYPTALKIAAIRLVRQLAENLALLQGAFQTKEKEFATLLKVGRTELQDAVPVTLGQEFSAYAEAITRDWWRLYKAEERLRHVNLGGTAVGTGLNAPLKYINRVIVVLREVTGLGLSRAENTFEATQNADIFAEVSGLVKTCAVNLHKIAGDLRLLSSGPQAGLAEINLPPLQAGSSLMPGKVNPVIPEMISQVAIQVIAADVAITMAASSGQLELNPFLPLIAHNLLHALTMLARAAHLFATRCVSGITANADRCRQMVEQNMCLINPFVPYIGYDQATTVVQEALRQNVPVTEILIQHGLFTPQQIAAILVPQEITTPGIAGINKIAGFTGITLGPEQSADKSIGEKHGE